MKNISKKLIAVSLSVLLALSATLPFNTYAATGTMGTESPAITFSFYNSANEQVDGNALSVGTYTVNVDLAGMASVSIFQLTASYDTSVVTALAVSSLYSTNMGSAGPVIEDGNIVFGLYSTNDDTTPIDSTGTTLATLSVTIASACDFDSVFTPSADPDYTFIQADYGDGYDMSYILGITEATGDYFPMTCDVSPALAPDTFSVSGTVNIATSLNGDEYLGGIVGITVAISDSNNTYSATTASDGTFTVADVPVGEYSVTISGSTTVDRTLTLSVSADKAVDGTIAVGNIGIVICDYNRDGMISATDTGIYAIALGGEYNVYCDFNSDGSVSATDTGIYSKFIGQTIEYSNVSW